MNETFSGVNFVYDKYSVSEGDTANYIDEKTNYDTLLGFLGGL